MKTAWAGKRTLLIIGAGVLAILFLPMLFASYERRIGARDAAEQARFTATLKAAASWRQAHDSLQLVSRARDDSLSALVASQRAAVARANHFRDVIARIPEPAPGDSTNPAWARLYAASAQETASLRLGLTDAERRIALLTVDRNEWRGLADSARVRILALERDLGLTRHRQRPCRVARLVPCPSRTAVGVAGLAIGYLATR